MVGRVKDGNASTHKGLDKQYGGQCKSPLTDPSTTMHNLLRTVCATTQP
jgi:hypothetical protein